MTPNDPDPNTLRKTVVMPKVAHHPDGTRLRFFKEPHVYELNNGRRPINVTTYIKQFFPKFARHAPAPFSPYKSSSANFGADIHKYAEAALNGTTRPVFAGKQHQAYCRVVDRCIDDLSRSLNFIEAEKIVFSHQDMLAGAIDMLMRDPADGTVIIFDWKTTGKLSTHNPQQRALPPYDTLLTDCNFHYYQCQLNLYRRLLDTQGYFPGASFKMMLIHLMPSEYHLHEVDRIDI